MKIFRIVSIFFVIGSGLVIAYFIVNNSNPAPASSLTTTKQPQNISSANEYKPPFEWFRETVSSGLSSSTVRNSNLTYGLINAVGQIINKEKTTNDFPSSIISNKTLSENISPISEKILNNALSDSLSDFNLVLNISDSDLKISQDVSRDAKARYLKALQEIAQKNLGDFNKAYIEIVYEAVSQGNPSPALQFSEISRKIADDYLNLAVPADWKEMHKGIIIYYRNASIIYRAIANYPQDAVKGYMALEMLEGLVNKAEEIHKEMVQKAQEIKS